MLLLLLACAFAAGAQDRPPNVVLILADDLGYNDISLHGNTRVRTPNIDRIGREGAWFTCGHTTAPVCSPSRAGLLTGRHQQRFGFEYITGPVSLFLGLAGGPERVRSIGGIIKDNPPEKLIPPTEMGIPQGTTNLAEMLRPFGYTNGIFGKWHVGDGPGYQPEDRGFDRAMWFSGSLYGEKDDPEVINAKLPWDSIDAFLWRVLPFSVTLEGRPHKPDEFLTTYQAHESIRFIEENKDDPFFLYLPFWAPHTPLQAPKEFYDRLDHIADHKTRVYYAMIECMDNAIGMVLDKLEELGLDENTLVIFTSDNGAAAYTRIPNTNQPFRGAKLNMYQGGVVVPYLMRWPARIPAGTVYHPRVSLMDIYPTIAAATGARLPDGETLDGVNLIPYIHGEKTAPPHDALVWRSGEYKAIWYGDYRLQIDGYQDKTVLYNIARDNGERNNLASAEPIVAEKLTAVLNEFTATFAEPRWEIPFEVPQPVDIWPGERPPDAETMYFGG